MLTGTYGGLVDSVVFADWIFFGLTVAALFVLRRRPTGEGASPDTFRTPLYPVVPLLFVAASLLVVASVVWSNPARALWGMLLLATGIPVYFHFARRLPGSRPDEA